MSPLEEFKDLDLEVVNYLLALKKAEMAEKIEFWEDLARTDELREDYEFYLHRLDKDKSKPFDPISFREYLREYARLWKLMVVIKFLQSREDYEKDPILLYAVDMLLKESLELQRKCKIWED